MPEPLHATPFIGLRAYTEEESRLFFGREREITELLRLVEDDIVTIFYGISGVGKSSLLAAGLFPRLRDRDYLPIRIRLDHYTDAPPLPLQVQRAVIDAARSEGVTLPAPTPDETLWQFFHHTAREFWTPQHRLFTPVLAIDQYEEFYSDSVDGEMPARTARGRGFLQQLLDLVRNRPPPALEDLPQARREGLNFDPVPLRVVLTLREDFFQQLLPLVDALAEQVPGIHRQRFRLQPLAADAAGEVINGPAQAGLLEVADEPTVAAIIRLAGNRRGVEPGTLALILSALDDERRRRGLDCFTPDLVERARGDLFERRVDEAVSHLPESVQQFVEDQLVSPGGLRRAVTAADANATLGEDAVILERLRYDGLLQMLPGNPPRLELVHDLLCPVLIGHRKARKERADAAAQRHAEEEARAAAARAIAAEEARDKEEKLRLEAQAARESLRRRAKLAWFLVVVACGVLIIAVRATQKAQRASQEAQRASQQKEESLQNEKNASEKAASHAEAEKVAKEEAARERLNAHKLVVKLFSKQSELLAGSSPVNRASFRQAIQEMLNDYIRDNPEQKDDSELLSLQATYKSQLGDLWQSEGKDGNAEESYRQAHELRIQVHNLKPDDEDWKFELSASATNLANFLWKQEGQKAKRQEALTLLRECVGLREDLQRADPPSNRWALPLLLAQINLATKLYDEGKRSDKRELFIEALPVAQNASKLAEQLAKGSNPPEHAADYLAICKKLVEEIGRQTR